MESKSANNSEPKLETKTEEEEDWFVECSDEEVYTKSGYKKGQMKTWEPEPKEIIEIFESIDKNGEESITLNWSCYGRRPMTPETESEYSDSGDEAAKESAKAAMDFDFDMDEDLNSTPTLAASRKALPGSSQRELKGSARKRTTDYKSILSNLERQKKLDNAERAAANSATSTPTGPK